MPEQLNITNLPSSRVEFIDPRTGLMSREWYRFFLNLFTLTGGGNNQTSLDDLQLAPPFVPSTGGGGSGTVTSVDVSGGSTGLTTSGGPITTSGTITLAGILNIANGGTGASTAAGAPFALKGANADITSLSGLTGAISSPTYVQFDTSYATALTAGQLGWDGNNTLGLGMAGGNVTQHIGEDQFFYCKATSAITKGQVVMFTGAVGASGVPTGAPATGITDGAYIMGIAAEAIPLNDFGLVQSFGTLRNVDTSGYADGDILWYDPSVTGGLTKTKPSAPNVKVQMAAVINGGSSGGGTILIRINPGSVLGGTDSNVQFGTLANDDLIAYDSTLGYWKNIPGSSYGTGTVTSVGLSLPAIFTVSGSPVTTTGTLTAVLASQTANYFFAAPDGLAGAPTFRAIVAADVPTLNQNTTGTASNVTGVVAVANGGTGQTTASAAFNALSPITTTGDLIIGNGTNSATRLAIGANNYVLTSNGTTAVWAVATGSGATISNDTTTAINIYPLLAAATSGSLATAYTSNAKLLYKPSTGEFLSQQFNAGNGIYVNSKTVSTSYTIATGNSGMSAGPITIASGQTVTVASGSRWVVL